MSARPDSIVEIVVGDAEFVSQSSLSDLEVPGIRVRQQCLVLFLPKQINGMNRTVFFHELKKVPFEGRLGCMRSCDLYTMAKRLEALLLPEYFEDGLCEESKRRNTGNNLRGTLPRTCA